MEKIFFVLTFLFLTSCSSSRIDRKIDDLSQDSLADESFLRWGDERLRKASGSNQKVISCYQGKSKDTLSSFKKDFLTHGKSQYYWLHIGNCYFIQESWTKAEFFYRMALDETKVSTVKSIALNNLGLIYFKYEQWEKGKEALLKSMLLSSSFKVPRYNLSQLYLQFGLYDLAIEVLSGSAFKGHKDIDIFFSLANAYLFKGDLESASIFFQLIPVDQFRREDIAATYALFLIKNNKIKDALAIMKHRNRSGVPEITAISQKIEKILLQRMKEDYEN